LDQEVLKVSKDLKVSKVYKENQAIEATSAQWVTKETAACLDFQVIQVLMVSLADQVRLENEVQMVSLVVMVLKDPLVWLDHLVLLVLQELEDVLVNVEEKVKPVKFQ